jgi:hypothetical protein
MQRRRRVTLLLAGLLLLASAVAGSPGNATRDSAASASVTGVMRLVSAEFGVVAVGPVSSRGTIPRARLFATTSAGAHFNEIGP